MADPISSIRNLGPAFEEACRRAGILTADDLRNLGPDAAYERVLKTGVRAHFIGYYAMVMGLQGRPWNDCRGREKDALRARFDAIKARAGSGGDGSQDKGRSEIEAALDAIGVIKRQAKP